MLDNLSKDSVVNLPIMSIPTSSEECHASIDLGSTETRGIFYSGDVDQDIFNMPVDVEPAFYTVLPYGTDTSDIKIMVPEVYDLLEIQLLKSEQEHMTILKGNLAKQYGYAPEASSSQAKSEQESTQANIHAYIVMSLINKMATQRAKYPDKYHFNIHLNLALPPEDTMPGRISAITQELTGIYQAKLPRLNLMFEYAIDAKDIKIMSECNATAIYYNMAENDHTDNDYNAIVVVGGGRSGSISIIKNGQLIVRLNIDNPDIGGSKMRELLIETISNNKDNPLISIENGERAMRTGFYKSNRTDIDAIAELNETKQKFAVEYVHFIQRALSKAGLQLMEIQDIIFYGRIFNTLLMDNGVVSPSLGTFIQDAIVKDKNLDIQFYFLEKEYPIPYGLACYDIGTTE